MYELLDITMIKKNIQNFYLTVLKNSLFLVVIDKIIFCPIY